jgi:ABC-type glycerol-3-phosphate transport system substrate-binding protein
MKTKFFKEKEKMKRNLLIVCSIVLFVTLTGCSNRKGKTEKTADETATGSVKGEYVGFNGVDPNISATITMHRHYADADKVDMDAAAAVMAKKYPGLKIEFIHRTNSGELKTWAAVGEMPDIFENTYIDTYISLLENGDIYNLDDAISATGFYDLFTNGKISQEGHTNVDGHQYSLSCEVNHVLELWYNKSLFKELNLTEPTNFDEFKRCITTLRDAGKIPIALFGAEKWPAMALYSLACIAEGEYDGLDAINYEKATFRDTPFRRAADKFKEIVRLGAFGRGALSTNYQQAHQLMATGQAGFFVSGSWYWLTTEAEGIADNVDWCNYNVFADAGVAEEVKGRCVGGGVKEQQYSVNAKPPSGLDPYTVALLLCEFEYNVRLNSAKEGNMTTVIGDFEFKGGEAYADFNKSYGSFKSFTTFPPDMTNTKLVTYLENAVEMMVSDNYTVEEFLQEMVASGF